MEARTEEASALLAAYAGRSAPATRYLWTDAFAVCTLLGLERITGDGRWRVQALRLISNVHDVLGRHRPDVGRAGWLSGLPEAEGAAHPTRGGLRIGKPLPERAPGEPMDERLEWDRDGQYFHYLTKWMHALDQTSRATGEPVFTGWARELADVAHRAFTRGAGPGRMYWKMSVDLTRPLVTSMGQHDPLDGLVTCVQLVATPSGTGPSLRAAIGDFAAMLDPGGLATADPLGVGGLLTDAYRLAQLERDGIRVEELIDGLLGAAAVGLRAYARRAELGEPAERRLAFRELGLAIGLAAIARDDWLPAGPERIAALKALSAYAPLGDEIESFWQRPAHRRVDSWLQHQHINDVMLAARLAPAGFLSLRWPG